MSYLLAILGFTVLIVLHEAGHFTVAKAVGMRVERFFLFFPPKLVSMKRGETEYGIGAIPAGGFVKITGMNPEEELPPDVAPRAYYHQRRQDRPRQSGLGPPAARRQDHRRRWQALRGRGDRGPADPFRQHRRQPRVSGQAERRLPGKGTGAAYRRPPW